LNARFLAAGSMTGAVIPTRIRVLTLIESVTVTGPARVLLDFAQEAKHAELGLPAVDVTFVTYRRGDGQSALAATAREAGVPVIEIPERGRWDPSVIPGLRRVVAEFQPDILESRNVKSHFLIRLAGLHRQFPWVAWNHGYTLTDRKDRAYNQLDRWSLRAAFRVIAVCKPFAARLEQRGVSADKVYILHNFVKPYAAPPEEEVQAIRQQLGLSDQLVVVTVGRMSLEKGHADLLSAIALLKEMPGLPRHRFVLVGDGPEEENLRRQAARLGIEEQIIRTGFQKNVAPYYALAKVFALPSHSEGSPNVILEAMVAGLAITSTNVGGVPEILEDGVTGLLVAARNPQALAEGLRRLLVSEELRAQLAFAAKRQAETAHTLQAYKRELTKFYVEVLGMEEKR
jgi:glycosyltransferase involved in cell wall biosynthesis